MKAFLLGLIASFLLLTAFALAYLRVDILALPAAAADTIGGVLGGVRSYWNAGTAGATAPASETDAPLPESRAPRTATSKPGTTFMADGVQLPVENMLQRPELPNGCEATSLAILLSHLGFYSDNVQLAYDYIPREDFWRVEGVLYGPHPGNAYAGDPAGENGGYYCFAPAIVEGAQRYLEAQYTDADIYNLTGIGIDGLVGQLQGGNPVIVWNTLDFGPARWCATGWLLADGSEYLPYQNLHCMVLTGYDETHFYLCDPLNEGTRMVLQEDFMQGFEALGRQAVVIELV